MNKAARAIDAAFSVSPRHVIAPTVSVVMVVYRTGEELQQSIDCVLGDAMVDEMVIVDNGSTAAMAERLRALGRDEPRTVLIQGHGNVGFATGANMGARAARGDHLIFLNPDAFLQPGCVASLVAGLVGKPSPSIVGACILDPDGGEQRGGRRGEVSALSTLLSLSRATQYFPGLSRFEIHRESEALPEGIVSIPTISGACFAMRRADFDTLSGFDEGYFLHVEDIDLCWRARRDGGSVSFDPQAKVVHLGHTSQSHPLKVELHKGMGLVRFFLKRAEGVPAYVLALAMAPLIMVTALVRPVLWRLRGHRA
jgi:N-acetylglucosaminyl-diphospho-decaprenol L-rhamnosyltransferase